MNDQAQGRIHGPDVVRGLAALGVVMFHVLYLSGIPVHTTAAAVAGRMDFFVRVFFVLSAFAIANAYCNRMGDVDSVRAFYLKRFFRIAPLFYFMALVGVIFRLAMAQPMPGALDFLLSGTFLFTLVPGKQSGLVGGGWSIGIEWLFYFLFPMMLAMIRNIPTAVIAWLILCPIAVLGKIYFQQTFDGQLSEFGALYLLSHAHYFVLGFLLLHLSKAGLPIATSKLHRHTCGLAFVATLAVTLYALRHPDAVPEEILLSFAAPLMVALSIAGFPAWLDNRFTRWLGLISYSTYLVQFPIIEVLQRSGTYAGIYKAIGRNDHAFVVAALLTLACVIVVAALTYRFIEVPGQRLYSLLRRPKRALEAAA